MPVAPRRRHLERAMLDRVAFKTKLGGKIPMHMQEGLTAYLYDGQPPGRFLAAVLANDLVASFGCADLENRDSMYGWADVMYNDMPGNAWKSRDAIDAWVERGGLNGKDIPCKS